MARPASARAQKKSRVPTATPGSGQAPRSARSQAWPQTPPRPKESAGRSRTKMEKSRRCAIGEFSRRTRRYTGSPIPSGASAMGRLSRHSDAGHRGPPGRAKALRSEHEGPASPARTRAGAAIRGVDSSQPREAFRPPGVFTFRAGGRQLARARRHPSARSTDEAPAAGCNRLSPPPRPS